MARILSGVSLCFMLVVATGACSSASTEGGSAGGGGNEAPGTATGGGGSGATTSAGGSATGGYATGGSATGGSATGGRAEGGRAGGTSAGGSGTCTPGVVTCVDAETAATCDDAGTITHVTCTDLAEVGINSTACVGDATEGNCEGEPADEDCLNGALVVAVCSGYTADQFRNLYIACFQNTNDIKPIVHCLAPFLPANEAAEIDCVAAEAACVAGEAGAGGAGG